MSDAPLDAQPAQAPFLVTYAVMRRMVARILGEGGPKFPGRDVRMDTAEMRGYLHRLIPLAAAIASVGGPRTVELDWALCQVHEQMDACPKGKGTIHEVRHVQDLARSVRRLTKLLDPNRAVRDNVRPPGTSRGDGEQ
ncbi:MAG TPA: hypothetical protein DEQ61_06870 [Streptomyces sp.]|nr:hypothetical protein [Streptomyces sp.]